MNMFPTFCLCWLFTSDHLWCEKSILQRYFLILWLGTNFLEKLVAKKNVHSPNTSEWNLYSAQNLYGAFDQSSESTYSCELNTQNPTIICDVYFATIGLKEEDKRRGCSCAVMGEMESG